MTQAHPERRRSPRFIVDGKSHGQLKTTIPVTIVNLSADGLLLELKAPLRPGTVYDLSAFVPEQTIQASVRVTRCRAGGYAADGRGGRCLLFRAGAEFSSLTTGQKDDLRRVVDRGLDAAAGSQGILQSP